MTPQSQPAAARPAAVAIDEQLLIGDFGAFEMGYYEEGIDTVLDRWSQALGLDLVCVWEYRDQWGCGGSSDLYVVTRDARGRRRFHGLPEGLWGYLLGIDEDTGMPPANERPADAEIASRLKRVRDAARRGPGKVGSIAMLGKRITDESGRNLACRRSK